MGMNIKEKLIATHQSLFGDIDILVASPGRVNIIGEHTDYNNGLVMPYTLDKHIVMSGNKSSNGYLRVYSSDLRRYIDFSTEEGRDSWCSYLPDYCAQD